MKNTANLSNSNRENSGSQLIKKSLYKYVLTILFLIILSPLSSSAQDCSLKLVAENNIESVNSDGRVFFIQLINNGNDAIAVNLSIANDNSGSKNSGKNPDLSVVNNNVSLNASIILENSQELNNIKISANETLKFQVKVTVPEGTPIMKWNNMILTASSEKCNNYSTSLVIYTFVPNPEEK
jgi:hypothetical protein